MPEQQTYEIEALEKVVIKTKYRATASSPEEAEQLCKSGKVDYYDKETQEADEWLETISIEEG